MKIKKETVSIPVDNPTNNDPEIKSIGITKIKNSWHVMMYTIKGNSITHTLIEDCGLKSFAIEKFKILAYKNIISVEL